MRLTPPTQHSAIMTAMTILDHSPSWAARAALRDWPAGQRHVMYQTWSDLLFLHWRLPPEIIQATLPPGLYADTFAGDAYIGIVPFWMNWIRPRYLPAIPWISFFLETNVRTYVFDEKGNSGVWFYSLDCNQPFAVWLARTFFRLPYEHAQMQAINQAGKIAYQLKRRGALAGSHFAYEPAGPTFFATPESLEFFLAERYLLFAATPMGLATGRVHHTPYPLQAATLTAWNDELLCLDDFVSPERPPDNILCSAGVDVRVYPLVRT